MKKLFTFIFALLSLAAMSQQKKVAVYVTGDEVEAKVLGSRLQTDIATSGKYTVIERNATFLVELKKEQSYQRTGAVDDEELSRLGKQFGVSLICVADIFSAFDESYVSARLIDVVSAEVIHSASANGNLQDYQNMRNISATLVNELLRQTEEKTNRKKVAVYIAQSKSKEIGRVLGDKLVTGFTRSGQYTAVERTNSFLSQLNKEQKYQRTGEVDDNDISRLGKQFGVQYVCVAEVSDYYGDQKYIAARLVDVETAELVDAYDGGGSINSMSSCVRMANEIAGKLSHTELNNSPSQPIEYKNQTTELLSYPIDTINGYIVYRYKVERGKGLYRIGQTFGVTQQDIINWNPQLVNRGIHPEEELLIPTGKKLKENIVEVLRVKNDNEKNESNHLLVKEKEGYRVQIFSSNHPQTAEYEAKQLYKQLSQKINQTIYVKHVAPFWKVRVGNFNSYEEAKEYKNNTLILICPELINNIYVVKDTINVHPELN